MTVNRIDLACLRHLEANRGTTNNGNSSQSTKLTEIRSDINRVQNSITNNPTANSETTLLDNDGQIHTISMAPREVACGTEGSYSLSSNQKNQITELLINRKLESILGGNTGTGNIYGDQTIDGLVGEIASIVGDQAINIPATDAQGNPIRSPGRDSYTGVSGQIMETFRDQQEYNSDGTPAPISTSTLDHMLKFIKQLPGGSVTQEYNAESRKEQLDSFQQSIQDLTQRLKAALNGTSTENATALISELAKLGEASGVLTSLTLVGLQNGSTTNNPNIYIKEHQAENKAQLNSSSSATERAQHEAEQRFWNRVANAPGNSDPSKQAGLIALYETMNSNFSVANQSSTAVTDTANTRVDAYKLAFNNPFGANATGVDPREEMAFADFKTDFHSNQEAGLKNNISQWQNSNRADAPAHRREGNTALAMNTNSKLFWTEQGNFMNELLSKNINPSQLSNVQTALGVQTNLQNALDQWLGIVENTGEAQATRGQLRADSYQNMFNIRSAFSDNNANTHYINVVDDQGNSAFQADSLITLRDQRQAVRDGLPANATQAQKDKADKSTRAANAGMNFWTQQNLFYSNLAASEFKTTDEPRFQSLLTQMHGFETQINDLVAKGSSMASIIEVRDKVKALRLEMYKLQSA